MKNKKSSLFMESAEPSIEDHELSANSESVMQHEENNGHHDVNSDSDLHHQLWLIYSQLKDAECNPEKRLEILECSRHELGQVLNTINQSITFNSIGNQFASPESDLRSPSLQAANLNCRYRKFNLTPDTLSTFFRQPTSRR